VQQGPKVGITIAALALSAALASPAVAANRIALLSCDLSAANGPIVNFLQISGESNQADSRDRGFAFESDTVQGDTIQGDVSQSDGGFSQPDVTGRSCARIMADLADDGFAFKSAEISGRLASQWVSIWQAE
jgi:hypothetical protein